MNQNWAELCQELMLSYLCDKNYMNEYLMPLLATMKKILLASIITMKKTLARCMACFRASVNTTEVDIVGF